MKTPLTIALDKAIELKLKAVERLVKELVEPLENIGNPEQLIGMPYEMWRGNQDVLGYLSKIYGTQEPNPLSDFIFKKEYARVKQLEEEM